MLILFPFKEHLGPPGCEGSLGQCHRAEVREFSSSELLFKTGPERSYSGLCKIETISQNFMLWPFEPRPEDLLREHEARRCVHQFRLHGRLEDTV